MAQVKYTAKLLRDITEDVVFESTDMMTGIKMPEYSVPHTYRAGTRAFKTKRAAKEWVDLINAQYPGSASL